MVQGLPYADIPYALGPRLAHPPAESVSHDEVPKRARLVLKGARQMLSPGERPIDRRNQFKTSHQAISSNKAFESHPPNQGGTLAGQGTESRFLDLAGYSAWTAAKELNRRSIPTPAGGRWHPNSVHGETCGERDSRFEVGPLSIGPPTGLGSLSVCPRPLAPK